MNKKLLAGLVAVGLLTGGGGATALAATAAPGAASTAAVVSSTSKEPICGPLGALVTKGTITKTQAMAIHSAFVTYFRGHWRSVLATVLGQLVKNHTITQAQASAVTTEITHSMQQYRGHHEPCEHGHGMGMTGGSGSR
jgi:hypothetical protein